MYAVRSLLLATLTLALVSPAFAQVVSAPVPTEADLVAVPGFPASGLPGQTSNDEFGTSVAGAGDVNGDGYADLIVGAPENDAGGLNSGRAYVYFGGPGSGVTPDLILTGETSGDNFGAAVASAGDVNGDGYDDVIVGAPESNGRGLNAGRAYVYFGGPTADAIADVIIAGSFLDQLGTSVSGAGDVNGDGFADVIVGVPFDDVGASNSGRARVYFGGPSMDAFADLTLTGTTENGNLGASVSGAGDVNGDGFADVIVGETGGGTTNEGRAYVFFGGSSADAVADLTLVGESMGDLFGESVSGAGDMNGDGFTDVIVGARNNDAGAGNAGRAYVFFGGTAPDAIADLVLTGTGTTDQLGDSVSGAGDVNGDSYDDVIIGVPFDDDGGINSGGAHVYFGGPVPDAVADLVLTGVADFDDFGVAVAGAGDLDGDGLADLAIGAPEADPNGASSGAAYVFSNANSGAGIAEWEAFGGASGDRFGAAVASAGDVNGDGYDDVIVGAPEYASSRGRAYVFYGGPGADAVPDVVLTGNALGDEFGRSVSGAGDVNGDGYDDVIVGAPLSDLEATDSGRANIYFGGPSMNATEDVVLTRDRGNARFGKSVSGAGDVNGDGYADVIVGSPTNTDLTSSSLAYVYFGGRTMNAEEDVVVRRLDFPIGTRFAEVVSDAGDVNGDGFGDMLVGEPGFGRAYVYFGGVTPDGVVDVTLTEESGVSFGSTVSGTGDVNGDGYADLVVGAPGNDAASSNDGRAYVYFGGAAFDGGADIVLTGPVNADSLGASVSGAGDVNGDGYADVIVGAPGADQGLPGTGQAYVYYGGRGGDGAPDLVFSGTGELEDLGRSVSGAGDFNGDGRADVIVGAPGNDTEGGDAGAAFVYRVTGPASSPGLFRLADVPGDQGGLLQARWTRSDQETLGNASSYLIERSEPAGVSGYAWEPVATVSASGRARYSLAVPTYSDQTGTNPGTTCVQVTAQGDSGETWRSMVSCGASIDNLSPAAPSSLALTQSPDGDVALTWDEVTGEPDLFGYDVFQSSTEACDATATLVGTAEGETTVTFEDDATAFGTEVFYCVAARDVHGNRSGVTPSASANPAILAAVKVVLEGAYDSGLPGGALMRTDIEDVLPLSQPFSGAPWSYSGTEVLDVTDVSPANGRPDLLDQNDVVDWVLVGVRNSATAPDAARAAALLLSDGTLLDPATGEPYASVKPAAPGGYFVSVYHRSHLAAMTALSITLGLDAPNLTYDLSASPAFVFGTNPVAQLSTNVYGLFSGDGDGDGSVLASDQQAVWLPAVGQVGYLLGDFNLDGSVLANDQQVLWLPNVGVQSAVPGAFSLTKVDAR